MRKFINYLCTMICCTLTISPSFGQVSNEQPKCMTFNYADLVTIRNSIKSGDNTYRASYNSLLATAGKLLTKVPEKITDGDMPPTGDPHDFYAIGKFSWPNPNTPNGMPYIRGDGKYNEEAFGDRYDLTRLGKTVSYINMLTLAWFYTQDERYAAKAGELLKTWFIDPKTRMNPNMNCSSALPGVYNGMAPGVIFTVVFIEMTDHVKMLRLSKSWDKASDDALKKWFSDYKTWLETSEFGISEKGQTSNHGTWYEAQLLAYSMLTGSDEGISQQFERAKKQVDAQVAPDGRLPREMKRVEGFHYFIYGLKAFTVLAQGFEQYGLDLWSYKTADNKSLILPYKFIIPYIMGQKPWTTGGTIDIKDADAIMILKQAAARYNLPESKEAIDKLRANSGSASIKQLYILQ